MARQERRFIYLLSLAYRRVQNWTKNEKGGHTAAQAGVLFLLGQTDGALIGEIARTLALGPPAASGLVERMEAAGLIERRPDEKDGRAWRLFLTKKGRALRAVAIERAKELNARMSDGFTEAELDIVARWLTSVQVKFAKENDP